MNQTTLDGLAKLVEDVEAIHSPYQIGRWSARAMLFLSTAFSQDEATRFDSLRSRDEFQTLAMRVGYIEGLIARAQEPEINAAMTGGDPQRSESGPQVIASSGRKVFVVHGHDDAAKESSARFLERLGLVPIILHEQASGGRTIIEKFERYSGDVVFAVVLLTPDDVGSTASESSNLKKRARQNVIMELGYFIGRLGRTRVCALHKGDVELPSDYQGVLYIEMDSGDAWKAKLAQELVQSKISIELAGLLGS